jgi:hypothetical protein
MPVLGDDDMRILWFFADGNCCPDGEEAFHTLVGIVERIVDRMLARAVPQIAQAERKRAFVHIMTQLSTRN